MRHLSARAPIQGKLSAGHDPHLIILHRKDATMSKARDQKKLEKKEPLKTPKEKKAAKKVKKQEKK